MRRKLVLLAVVGAVLMAIVATGIVASKGHVAAGEVQVSHKGREAIDIDAPALRAHLGHGDIQLPACDFNNVFHEGDDTSNVVSSDSSGVTYSDIGFVPRDSAEGLTPGCPPGTF